MKLYKRTHMNFAKVFAQYRKHSKWSQRDLALKLGLTSPQLISNVERGRCALPPNKLAHACHLINMPHIAAREALIADYTRDILAVLPYQPQIEEVHCMATYVYPVVKKDTEELV